MIEFLCIERLPCVEMECVSEREKERECRRECECVWCFLLRLSCTFRSDSLEWAVLCAETDAASLGRRVFAVPSSDDALLDGCSSSLSSLLSFSSFSFLFLISSLSSLSSLPSFSSFSSGASGCGDGIGVSSFFALSELDLSELLVDSLSVELE